MKHKNLLKLMVLVMVLAMAMTMLVACNKPEEPVDPEPEDTFTAQDAANEISDAIVKSLCAVDGKEVKPVGFQYALAIPTDTGESRINIAGHLDTKTAANTKVYLDYIENEFRLFSLSVNGTDGYIYFDSMDAKRKFPGFKLANNLVGEKLPDADSISGGMIGGLPGMVFDLIMDLGEKAEFEHDVDEVDGTIIDTINGSLSGLAPMIGSVVDGIIPGVGAKLGDFLAKVNLELTATINKAGTLDYVDLVINADGKEIPLTFESKLEQDFNPFTESDMFKLPKADDTRYIETSILNFQVAGEFNLADKSGYEFVIRADINPFELLEKGVVSQTKYVRDDKGKVDKTKTEKVLAFDVTKLLDLEEGGFYLGINHKHAVPCDKIADAEGSVLSAAFSKKAFGNNNIYISFNPQALVPAGLVTKAFPSEDVRNAITAKLVELAKADKDHIAILDKVTEIETAAAGSFKFDDAFLTSLIPAGQQIIQMDVKALLGSASAPVNPNPDGITAKALENYNPLKTVADVWNFLSGITYDEENGVRFETASISAAVDYAETIITEQLAKNSDRVIGAIGKILVDKGENLDVSAVVDAAFNGNESFEIKFFGNDKNTPDAKKTVYGVIGNKKAVDAKNFKADFYANKDDVVLVNSVEKAGQFKITDESKIKNSDVFNADGSFKPMSENEWKAFMNAPKTIDVKYTEMNKAGVIVDGNKKPVMKTVTAKVVTISGLDYSIKDRPQDVIVVLAPVSGILKDNGHLAAHQFKTQLTVASLVKDGAVFTPVTANAFVKDKKAVEYKYGTAIAPNMNLKLTYNAKGADKKNLTKEYKNIAPSSNKNLVAGGKVNAVANFKLGYNVVGYTFEQEVTVKVATAQVAKNATAVAGTKFELDLVNGGVSMKIDKVGDKDAAVVIKGATLINDKTVSIEWGNEPARKVVEKKYLKDEAGKLVLDADGNKQFVGYTIVFDEASKDKDPYTLTVKVNGGFSQTINFTVNYPKPAAKPAK